MTSTLDLSTGSIEDAAAEAEPREAFSITPEGHIVLEPNLLTTENLKLLSRGIRKRRSVGIVGFGGLNGQGKSMAMVRDTLPSLALGRRVLSTVAFHDPHTGNPHPLYVPFRSWHQLHDFNNGDVCLDEVTGMMDSRDQGMPKKIKTKLPQMRRSNVLIRWTGIDWDNADKRLRQITGAFVMCKGFMPVPLERQDGFADALAMWRPNRLFRLTTYDAQTLTKPEDSAQMAVVVGSDNKRKKRAKIKNIEMVWGPGSLAFRSYNTLDAVAAVDNSCQICGGKIPEKTCRGHD